MRRFEREVIVLVCDGLRRSDGLAILAEGDGVRVEVEAHRDRVAGGVGVVDVDEPGVGVVGVEGEPEEAPVADDRDPVAQVEKRLRAVDARQGRLEELFREAGCPRIE